MASKVDECVTVIKSQEVKLITQSSELRYIKRLLTNYSPEADSIHHHLHNVPLKLMPQNNVSLNHSGPSGIGYIQHLDTNSHVDEPQTTQSLDNVNAASSSASDATSTPKSPTFASVVMTKTSVVPTQTIHSSTQAPVAPRQLRPRANTGGRRVDPPAPLQAPARQTRNVSNSRSRHVDPPAPSRASAAQTPTVSDRRSRRVDPPAPLHAPTSPTNATPGSLKAAAPRIISWHIFNFSEGTTSEDMKNEMQNENEITLFNVG
ncbi:hypothetical protein O0L34_g17674 [Tuta absoluta]|nr:hypothetical protein O0L34_g17674 [Tuta absoluta]